MFKNNDLKTKMVLIVMHLTQKHIASEESFYKVFYFFFSKLNHPFLGYNFIKA